MKTIIAAGIPWDELLKADVMTLALLAVVLLAASPLVFMAVFRESIKSRIQSGGITATGESARSLISKEWLDEVAARNKSLDALEEQVNLMKETVRRHGANIGNLEDNFMKLREKVEGLANDLTECTGEVRRTGDKADAARAAAERSDGKLDRLIERLLPTNPGGPAGRS